MHPSLGKYSRTPGIRVWSCGPFDVFIPSFHLGTVVVGHITVDLARSCSVDHPRILRVEHVQSRLDARCRHTCNETQRFN